MRGSVNEPINLYTQFETINSCMSSIDVLTAGFIVVDIISARLPRIPDPGELIYAPLGIKLRMGGHPANVSVDLIQMGLERGSVGTVGAVGEDLLKDFIREVLEFKGAVTFLQEVEGMETGKTIILVVEGEDRRCVNEPGANLSLSFDHVLNVLKEVRPRIFYIASGLLGEFDFRVWELVKFCKENNIATMIDLVKPIGKGWNYIHPALKFADVMHCNVYELKGVSGEHDLREGLRWLIRRGVKLPIISDGEKGVISLFQERYIRQPAFTVEVVDPTGAGDALCAGILFKLIQLIRTGTKLEELPLEEISKILMYGQAAGAACIGEIGTTPGVTADRIRSLIDEQGEKILSSTSIESA